MSKKIGLVPYLIRLKNLAAEKDEPKYFVTNKLPGGLSLKDVICEYLQERIQKRHVNKNLKSVIKAEQITNAKSKRNELIIKGIIKCGEYGFHAELENVDTGDPAGTRTVKDCEYLPFYYRFMFRDGQDEAILILQKFGSSGIRTNLVEDMGPFIEGKIKNSFFEINPIISESYIQNILQHNGISKIIYTKRFVHEDIADDVFDDDHVEKEETMELVIKAGRKGFLGLPKKIKNKISSESEGFGDILEINNVIYDRIKVEVKLKNGKRKTIDLEDYKKFNMPIDVTEDVKMTNGHPSFDSIDKSARGILEIVRDAINWQDKDEGNEKN